MRRLPAIFVLLMVFTSSVAAKQWRGILPMHSTRAEVEALLGPAPILRGNKAETDLSIYTLDEGEVRIVFADEKFLNEHPCPPISVGTVLRIEVVPKDEIPLSRFIPEEKLFRKFEASDPPDSDFAGFVDEKEGFVVRAYKGMAHALYYLPSDADRARCSALYQMLEEYAKIRNVVCGLVMKFDEYGNILYADEKARLDNFAIQIQNQPNDKGYIIVYAGRKALVAEAQVRGNRARQYLISVRKIDPDNVVAIDGGFRDELTVTLYVLPADVTPPITPSIDPSQVEIIYEKKRRPQKGKKH